MATQGRDHLMTELERIRDDCIKELQRRMGSRKLGLSRMGRDLWPGAPEKTMRSKVDSFFGVGGKKKQQISRSEHVEYLLQVAAYLHVPVPGWVAAGELGALADALCDGAIDGFLIDPLKRNRCDSTTRIDLPYGDLHRMLSLSGRYVERLYCVLSGIAQATIPKSLGKFMVEMAATRGADESTIARWFAGQSGPMFDRIIRDAETSGCPRTTILQHEGAFRESWQHIKRLSRDLQSDFSLLVKDWLLQLNQYLACGCRWILIDGDVDLNGIAYSQRLNSESCDDLVFNCLDTRVITVQRASRHEGRWRIPSQHDANVEHARRILRQI